MDGAEFSVTVATLKRVVITLAPPEAPTGKRRAVASTAVSRCFGVISVVLLRRVQI